MSVSLCSQWVGYQLGAIVIPSEGNIQKSIQQYSCFWTVRGRQSTKKEPRNEEGDMQTPKTTSQATIQTSPSKQ